MVIGLHDSWAKESRGRTWRFLRRTFVVWLFLAVAAALYWAGAMVAHSDMEKVVDEVAALSRTVEDLKRAADEARAAAKQAADGEAQWRSRYEREVPVGPAKDLQKIIEERMKAGVSPARLASVIGMISEKRTCDKPERPKRVAVKVPPDVNQAPVEEVAEEPASFAEGAIVVTTEGEPRVTARGTRQTGFDPAKPVTVRFAVLGGGGSTATGVLPLQHSVTIGEYEFRFQITANFARNAVATAERCKLP